MTSESKRNSAKNTSDIMRTNSNGGKLMGTYEQQLMKELDELEVALNKRDRKSRGYCQTGDGSYVRRSGHYEETEDEWT